MPANDSIQWLGDIPRLYKWHVTLDKELIKMWMKSSHRYHGLMATENTVIVLPTKRRILTNIMIQIGDETLQTKGGINVARNKVYLLRNKIWDKAIRMTTHLSRIYWRMEGLDPGTINGNAVLLCGTFGVKLVKKTKGVQKKRSVNPQSLNLLYCDCKNCTGSKLEKNNPN